MTKPTQNIYMIGIAGMGMCPLAIYLAQSGHNVIGIDNNMRSEVASLLKKNKVKIDSTNTIPELCDCVIYSSAISPLSPIFSQAKEHGLTLIRRGDYLAQLAKNKKLIAIVGSHGKTTTAAMLIHALNASKFHFSFLLGALFHDPKISPARYSSSDWIVAEVDESDGTIDSFSPEITLVVNFDWDHPAQYTSVEALESTFYKLFKRTRQTLIIPKNCSYLQRLANDGLSCDLRTYGSDGDFEGDFHIDSQGDTTLVTQGLLPNMKCNIPNSGLFNAHNGLAALSVAHLLLDNLVKEPFKGFLGVKRRQERLYESQDFMVMMDYAHHPTEVEALLSYIRASYDRHTLVVFQPHRYTRTQAYYKDFARVLLEADQVILLPVYAASEPFIASGTSQLIKDSFDGPAEKMKLIDYSQHQLFQLLPRSSPQEPMNVLFVGAGDIELLALEYRKRLEWASWWQSFLEKIDAGTKVSENEPLASKTTMRLGGSARFYIEPVSLDDLIRAVKGAYALKCPIFTLGRGSNLIIPDEGVEGLVIRLNHPHWKEIRDLGGGRIWAGAGARLKEICGYACKSGLAGFEFLEGIPGSLGGSLRMNAGAMGGWLFDVIESIKCITPDGHIKEFSKQDLTLGYRFCKNLETSLAIGAILKSSEVQDQEVIRQKLDSFATKRKATQPREPSAGCIFKNPEGNYAGKLIEASGLKGFSVGAAEVSCVHCNFIVNKGGATSNDVVQLVRTIRDRVHKASGVYLEPEVLFLGKSWDQELQANQVGLSHTDV